jgi:signal transduction histidine kinase
VAQGEARKELEQAAREGRAEDERWHARKDGSRFFASGILMRMQNVDSPRFIKVLRDMTAQKHAEELRLQQQGRIAVLEERQRIAQELHDTLAQSFTGIALQLSAANDVLESESERARAHITRAQTIARESLQESRRVVQALRPTLLQTQGLPQALAQLIEKATTGAAVEGMCHIEGTSRPLLPRIEEDLLRIAQEAVTNALRHSQGTQVRVTLRYEPNRLLLTVSDNGQGFDVQATAPAGHFGLKGIGERVERMGGQLTLHSEEGHGTELGVIFTSP